MSASLTPAIWARLVASYLWLASAQVQAATHPEPGAAATPLRSISSETDRKIDPHGRAVQLGDPFNELARATDDTHDFDRVSDGHIVLGSGPLDEPGLIRFPLPVPNPPHASCPGGFFAAIVDDGPGTGLSAGSFGMELLLDEPGSRELSGGLNFGGLIDASQPGFAAFNIANAANDMQRVSLSLTGSPASSAGASYPVRVQITRRTGSSNDVVYERTQTISLAAPFDASFNLPPGFYVATVAPVDGTAGGAPDGQFFFSLSTSLLDRPGGGFQGGAVVGGYHAIHPFGGVSGFAAFCLGTPHSSTLRVLAQPSYGPTGASDLRLRVQDSQRRDIAIEPEPAFAIADVAIERNDPARSGREVGARVFAPVGASGTRKLVLISHGGLGTLPANPGVELSNFTHIAEPLAQAGFVAVVVGHRNSGTLEQHRLDRPRDVSFLIDQIALGSVPMPPGFQAQIDTARVGHTGHSAGAYTSMALAGAVYPYGSFRDPRIVAIAPISPQGVGEEFLAYDNGPADNTWAGVQVPTFVLVGRDELDSSGTGAFISPGWRLQPFGRMTPTQDRIQVIIDQQDHLEMGGSPTLGTPSVRQFIGENIARFFSVYLAGRAGSCELGRLALPDSIPSTREFKRAQDGRLLACPA